MVFVGQGNLFSHLSSTKFAIVIARLFSYLVFFEPYCGGVDHFNSFHI